MPLLYFMKLAAIDIGSNAVRLVIYRIFSGGQTVMKKLEFIRIPLRLGDDVFKDKMISQHKEDMLIKTMKAFSLIMEVHGVADYEACATSAMRDSMNGKELVAKVKKTTGINIEIIDGIRESQLILDSILNMFPDRGDFLNIDVGGGSTEMTLIHDHKPVMNSSFDIGTVRLLYGNVPQSEWERMQAWVQTNSEKMKGLVAVGTGGNINKAFRLLELKDLESTSHEKIKNLYESIREMTLKERIYKMRLNPDRADVIEPALKIHLSIMKWAGIKKIFAPNAGLKDGIIRELMKRNAAKIAG